MESTGAAGKPADAGDVAHLSRGASSEQVTTIGFDGSASVFMPPPPAGLSMLVRSRYDNSSLREYPRFTVRHAMWDLPSCSMVMLCST